MRQGWIWIDLTMVPSGSSIRSEKGANGEKLLRCEVRESAVKSSPWRVGRRAARGGKVEVTELGPKWLPLLPMCSFSIMETILTLNTSMNSLEECFCRCEQHLHHHTRLRRLCADMVWSARKVAILCLNDFPQAPRD